MSTTKTMKITGLAALALVAALAFTGCSGNSPTATAPEVATTTSAASSGTAATTPAPTATAAPIKSGQHLTAEQATSLPQTARAYTLADGSLVATVIGEALPPEVVTDIAAKAQVASGGEGGVAGTAEAQAKTKALEAAVKGAGVATGRLVVAVFPVYGYRTASSGMVHFWNTTRYDGDFFDSADQAKADVEAQFAKNPTGVEIVVLTK